MTGGERVGELVGLLESASLQAAARPLELFVVLAVSGFLLQRQRGPRTRGRAARWFAPLVVATYIVLVGAYLAYPAFADAAEPTIPAISSAFLAGAPLYHASDAAARYTHVYGPGLFLVHGWALRLPGSPLLIPKLVGALAACIALALLYYAVRVRSTPRTALDVAAGAALIYLAFRHRTFWPRPEPLLLLSTSAAVAAMASRGRRAMLVMVTFACAFGISLKITAVLYFLPLFGAMAERVGWRSVLIALVCATVLAFAPFLALTEASLANYAFWLSHSGGRLLNLATLRQNVDWAVFLLVPTTLAWRGSQTVPLRLLALTGLSLGVASLIAAKPGAGSYHLLPFVPVLCWFVGCAIGTRQGSSRVEVPATWAFTAVLVFLAVGQQVYFWRTLADTAVPGAVGELTAIADRYAGRRIEMGYADNYRPTFYRPVLAQRQAAYFLDAPAVIEHQLSGIGIPPSTLRSLAACHPDVWLIPTGGTPFHLRSPYSYAPVFDQEFRDVFHASYRLSERTAHYDVWMCAR